MRRESGASAGSSRSVCSSPVGRRTVGARACPSRHDELALAVSAGTDDWRHLVRKDRRQGREVAGVIMLDGEQIPDG